jgi:KDO2-lipid IV(A) lauroyltransferase
LTSAAPAGDPGKSQRRPTLRHVAEYVAVRALTGLISLLGVRLGSAFARLLGRIYFVFDRRHARIAQRNIEQRWGLGPEDARRMARRAFQHIFVSAVEILHVDREIERRGFDDIVKVENVEVMQRAFAKGKGVVLVSAHLGNWEVVARIARRHGWPFTTVYRPLDNPLLDRWIHRYRSAHGQAMVPKWGAIRPFLKSLRAGEMAVILIDQDARRRGIMVPFMDVPASTIPTPVELALRTGAEIVTAFSWRTGPGFRHVARFDPPLEITRTGDRDADVHRITAEINRRLEAAIENAPDQWLWGHRRWKSSPPAPPRKRPAAPSPESLTGGRM